MAWSKTLAANIHRKVPFFDVEDLIQAGHLGLWRAAVKFDVTRNDCFRAFAFEYVRGEVWMSVRRAAFRDTSHEPMECRVWDRSPDLTSGVDYISRSLPASQANDILLAVQLRQMNKFLRAAIKTLTAAERYVLEEHVIEGRVMRDVAAEIGRKVVTGFTYKRAALAKLREFLRARGIEGVEL